MTWAISKRTSSWRNWKHSLRSFSRKLSLWLLGLFTDLLTKAISCKLWMKILPNLILSKENYIFLVTSIQTCIRIKIMQDAKSLVSATVSNDVKNYLQFCTIFGLTQIIKSPARITCSSTPLIDHMLVSLSERISQEGVKMLVYQTTNSFITLEKIVELKREVCTKKLNSVPLRLMWLMLIKTLRGK